MKRPRVLVVLGILTMLVGGFGLTYALGGQLSVFLDGEDHFVEHYRERFAERPELASLSSDERERIGTQLGEQEWARRGVEIPLGVANALLSFLSSRAPPRRCAATRGGTARGRGRRSRTCRTPSW